MSRLSHFRDLLSQVEHEYVMLLGEPNTEDDGGIERLPCVSPEKGASGERYFLEQRGHGDEGRDTVISLDDSDFGINLQVTGHDNTGDEVASSTSAYNQAEDHQIVDRKRSSHSQETVGRVSVRPLDSLDSRVNTDVFPYWWNPDGETLKQLVAWQKEGFNQPALGKEEACGIFSPLSFPKLHWDMVGYVLILYVAWEMPFQITYGSESLIPSWMNVLDAAITVFFALDVLLNFNTGFLVNGHVVFDRCAIAKRYSRGWFFFDFVTCVPFAMLDQGGSSSTHGRLLRALQGLKPIRLIRLVQTVRFLQTSETLYFSFVTSWKDLFQSVAFIAILVWNVHVLSCVWSAMQPVTWKETDFGDALRTDFNAFVEIFLALLTGSRLASAQTVGMQMLEMFIATERVFLVVGLCFISMIKYRLLNADEAKARFDCKRALHYLRLRGTSLKTAVEVFRVFNDGASARCLRRDVETLRKYMVPTELQQKINIELWQERLMTMGIIRMVSFWDDNFAIDLAMCCSEEICASGAVLFNLADSASAAYYILAGEFQISSPLMDEDMPSFTVCMWLGEDALVSPVFRRGLKAYAVQLSSVMVVPSDSFQGILLDLKLADRYDEWVQHALWRGICGRCGKIGDHFQDKCPSVLHVDVDASDTMNNFAYNEFQVSHAELQKYLRMHNLRHLAAHLNDMGIISLSDLQELDLEEFRQHLSKKNPPVTLTRRDSKRLLPRYVNEFEAKLRKGSSIVGEGHHFIFLSHYKVEAGTEAALMLSELENMIRQDDLHVANQFAAPVFLDSEDLTNLVDLQRHVKSSMNVVLLLTSGVLSRPWCLVELVTASQNDIPVSLVRVEKLGITFEFPTEAFYADLSAGKTLNDEAKQLLSSCDIDLATIESTLREIFKNIALSYSPHRSMQIRHAEMKRLLENCNSISSTFSIHGAGSSGSQRMSGSRDSISRDSSRRSNSQRMSSRESSRARSSVMLSSALP